MSEFFDEQDRLAQDRQSELIDNLSKLVAKGLENGAYKNIAAGPKYVKRLLEQAKAYIN